MAQCLLWISTAFNAVLDWFDRLFTGDFKLAYFASVAILFAVRFLIMPVIGVGISDRARRIVRENSDDRRGR